ncbi:MAG: hypothetical protein LUH12_04310, partial [Bacteroides sp.]|nr:hypothetical protein [Bacteroides sp.]
NLYMILIINPSTKFSTPQGFWERLFKPGKHPFILIETNGHLYQNMLMFLMKRLDVLFIVRFVNYY